VQYQKVKKKYEKGLRGAFTTCRKNGKKGLSGGGVKKTATHRGREDRRGNIDEERVNQGKR